MKTITAGIAGLVMFTILIALVVGFYGDLKTSYVPASETAVFETTDDDIGGENVGERLSGITVLNGINGMVSALKSDNPGAGIDDIAGNLLLLSLGSILVVLGIFTAPFEIAYILEAHYVWIPPFFLNGLLALLIVFIYINYKKLKTRQGGL